MRFGQDFHRRIVPEWDQHYIDYNLLKRLAKSSTPPENDEDTSVIEYLSNTISSLESFLGLQLALSSVSEGQLLGWFGLRPDESAAISASDGQLLAWAGPRPDELEAIPAIEEARHVELRVLLGGYCDIIQQVKRIQWFERVNTEGLQRIFSKLQRCGNGVGQPHYPLETRWRSKQTELEANLLKRLDRLAGLRDSLKRVLSLPEPLESISLHLRHTPDRTSGFRRHIDDDLQRALRNGDMDAIVQLVMAPSSLPAGDLERTCQRHVLDLLRFSLLVDSEQSSALLRALRISAAQKAAEVDILNWSIVVAGRERLLASQSDTSQYSMTPDGSYYLRLVHAMLEATEHPEPGEDGLLLMKKQYDTTRLSRALHEAAKYGLVEVCKKLMEILDKCGRGLDALLSGDLESLTPLHRAVEGDHTLTAKYVIDSMATVEVGYRSRSRRRIMGEVLHVALRNQNDEIINHLVRGITDVGIKSARGETALHIAAQLGRADYTTLLIEAMREKKAELEVPDLSRGWTPLFSACAGGHLDVAKLLVQAGLSPHKADLLGWTARENAIFRGYLNMAVPGSLSVESWAAGPASLPVAGTVHAIPRCREGESIIIACLGNTRKDREVKAVDLSYYHSSPHSPAHYEGLSYILEVTALGTSSQPRRVRLPILDDTINDPFVFPVSGTIEPRLVFRVFRLGPGENAASEVVVAGGTALLESNTHCFGVKRQSLIREHTAAILDKETMLVAGTVTFTVLIAKPFPHLQTARSVDVGRESSYPPVLVGHRGRGMNLKTQQYLQLGENTVESLITAGRLGAQLVEFDIQVTKDLEAVAYHDFSLSESGTDVPIHDLTLDQYMYASNIQSPHANPLSLLGRVGRQEPAGRQRSRSLGQHFEAGATQIQDRMKHTVAFKLKGFNANTRGDFIQGSFATLKEILAQLPQDIGCDIEIKYPRLHEAVHAGVAPIAIELNTFVDIVLDILHQHGGDRQIFLSSFTPEICILLSMKQRAYPVFFITNAGKMPMIDLEVRAASLQVAVQFARRWNLAGVVFACEALLLCPRLVGFVKARNLVCASYGVLNNEPENVKIQAEAGVDIIIADRVGLIAKTLAALS